MSILQCGPCFCVCTLRAPDDADFAVNVAATSGKDSVNGGLVVWSFDDTTEEGVTWPAVLPENSGYMILTTPSRAHAAPPAARTVGRKLYYRQIADGVAVSAWNSLVLDDFAIPDTAYFQTAQQQLVPFSTFSPALAAGNYYQFELTRIAPAAGTALVGDWDLLGVGMVIG